MPRPTKDSRGSAVQKTIFLTPTALDHVRTLRHGAESLSVTVERALAFAVAAQGGDPARIPDLPGQESLLPDLVPAVPGGRVESPQARAMASAGSHGRCGICGSTKATMMKAVSMLRCDGCGAIKGRDDVWRAS